MLNSNFQSKFRFRPRIQEKSIWIIGVGEVQKFLSRFTSLGGDRFTKFFSFSNFSRNFAKKIYFRIEFSILIGDAFHPQEVFSYSRPYKKWILNVNLANYNLLASFWWQIWPLLSPNAFKILQSCLIIAWPNRIVLSPQGHISSNIFLWLTDLPQFPIWSLYLSGVSFAWTEVKNYNLILKGNEI